jgi:hypothetical protein
MGVSIGQLLPTRQGPGCWPFILAVVVIVAAGWLFLMNMHKNLAEGRKAIQRLNQRIDETRSR